MLVATSALANFNLMQVSPVVAMGAPTGIDLPASTLLKFRKLLFSSLLSLDLAVALDTPLLEAEASPAR